MAKVIISHFSPIRINGVQQSIVFYAGLIKALTENGNDVLQIITNDFVRSPWNGSNKLRKRYNRKKLYRAVREFGPDFILSFNNSKFEDIENIVDCPIILWDADYFEYFNDKESVKQNKDRYIFFSFSDGSRNDIRERVAPSADRLHLVKSATAVTARDVAVRDNISFIGTFFAMGADSMMAFEQDLDGIMKMMRAFNESRRLDLDDLRARKNIRAENVGSSCGVFMQIKSGEWRTRVIAAVAPLGLRIFGPRDWYSIASFSVDAFLSYDPRLAYSLAHNEDIYNRSRIAINITHKQNVSAYPWRVPDIMASNACLVSDYSRELVADFGATVPLQTYESPGEAHDICKRLLADEPMREDIAAASRAAIRDGFTWEHRLRDISQILGVSLYDPQAAPGRYEVLNPTTFLKAGSRFVNMGKRTLVNGIDKLLDRGAVGPIRIPLSAKKKRRIRRIIGIEPNRPSYELQK